MADGYIGIDEPTTIDKKADTEEITVGANTVHRERVQIAGATATQIAGVTAAEGLDVDVTRLPALVAGTANIGDVDVLTLPALPAGTNNIGDVDVLTVPAPLSTTGAGTAATALRTTHASDDPVTTALQIMDDWDNAASDGASVSGDVAHDAGDAGEPVKIGAKAYSPDGTTPGVAVAENDRTNLKADLDGIQYVNTWSPQNFSYHDDDAAAVTTDGAVKADPGDGFAVFITDIVFSIGAATASSIFLEEGTTKILGPYYLEAIAGRGLAIHFETPKRCTASTAILVTNTGSILFSIDILGFVAAV
jgi:hypothetical protein